MTLPSSVTLLPEDQPVRMNDPIIERDDVMWAARKFILIYGDHAPNAVAEEITRLDLSGKLQVAAMFERVREECVFLLKKSEKLRDRNIH